MSKYDINQSMIQIKMWHKTKYYTNQNISKYDTIWNKSKYVTYRNISQSMIQIKIACQNMT